MTSLLEAIKAEYDLCIIHTDSLRLCISKRQGLHAKTTLLFLLFSGFTMNPLFLVFGQYPFTSLIQIPFPYSFLEYLEYVRLIVPE
jgi:hypothetical protein